MWNLLIEQADVEGNLSDVRIRNGRIAARAPELSPLPDERRLHAHGGALLPGLQDHHVHILALAASLTSLACGPPRIRDAGALEQALRQAAEALPSSPGGMPLWIRGIGYHEQVAGELTRARLDAWVAHAPVRIQDRSGALWSLNSKGLEQLHLGHESSWPPGLERDATGRPTGRLWRLDRWLRERLGSRENPDLSTLGQTWLRLGVTGICDATPNNGPEVAELLRSALDSGEIPQRLLLMGGDDLPPLLGPRLRAGPRKVMLDEDQLPSEHELEEIIRRAHGAERPVAFHCVTRAELLMAIESLIRVGCRPGDRIEHASIAPPDLIERMRLIPLRVITQPNFLYERGDTYRSLVPAHDQPWLYRCRGFLAAGIPLAGGTDAPFGDPDPWAAMRAAVDRRSEAGIVMGAQETLNPEEALALFTSSLQTPGQNSPQLIPGEPADLILLDRPWKAARERLDRADLRATLIGGQCLWENE